MTKENALNYIKFPVRFDEGGYIWDSEGFMVAQVRGWGNLSSRFGDEKAADIQDALGLFITSSLNSRAEKAENERLKLVVEANEQEITALEREKAELREVLEVYANENNWMGCQNPFAELKKDWVGKGNGFDLAKKLLEKIG